MVKLNTYINFKGNTEEAFNFYRSVFGGEFSELMRWKDMPKSEGCEDMNLSEEDGEKIMHVALPVGNGDVLMGSDALESMPCETVFGNNFSIGVGADSKEELEKMFNSMAEGGTVTMPLADTFWGAYFGMLTDKFGIQWLFNHDYKNTEVQ